MQLFQLTASSIEGVKCRLQACRDPEESPAGNTIFTATGNSDGWSNDIDGSDPKLTLNLLRQKNEAEIRCGSAKLAERRSLSFSSNGSLCDTYERLFSADGAQTTLRWTPPPQLTLNSLGGCNSASTVCSKSPQEQSQQYFVMNVGLSLEAAPFSLSQESATLLQPPQPCRAPQPQQ